MQLAVAVPADYAVGLDLAPAVADCFGAVGKLHKERLKLQVHAEEYSK